MSVLGCKAVALLRCRLARSLHFAHISQSAFSCERNDLAGRKSTALGRLGTKLGTTTTGGGRPSVTVTARVASE